MRRIQTMLPNRELETFATKGPIAILAEATGSAALSFGRAARAVGLTSTPITRPTSKKTGLKRSMHLF